MSKTGFRYKDVLFALAVAHDYNQSLGKLQLQKFIYLADVLFPLWQMVSANGYRTYKHGPYDPNIQNAVDVLAFRGAVEIVKSNFASNQVQVNYEISEIGVTIVRNFQQKNQFAQKYEVYRVVGKYVDDRGWDRLKKLVYSESTYLTAKSDGYGQRLNLGSLLSNESLQILDGFNNLVRDQSSKLTKKSLISIFFKMLDNYQLLSEMGN